MRRDHHELPYDEGTVLKLTLFEKYLESWLPVFIHSQYIKVINIIDFFSGPGEDNHGVPGSPLRTATVVSKFCNTISSNGCTVNALFNDIDSNKIHHLISKMESACPSCMNTQYSSYDFKEAFYLHTQRLPASGTANLLFIDPTGIINQEIFENLVSIPKTDFILFLPSEFIHRFKNTPEFINKFPNLKDINSRNPKSVAHSFCATMESTFLRERHYHLAHFGIKKSSGKTHAVIFGSGSLRGLEKFLEQCWKLDKHNGEASFSLEGDLPIGSGQLSLPGIQSSSKLRRFEEHLKNAVRSKLIKTNKDAYIFSLKAACLPRHASKLLQELKREGIIQHVPAMSYKEIFSNNSITSLGTL